MDIPDNLLDYVKEEARRFGHGRIIIELNESADKVYVVTEFRRRFSVEEERKQPLHDNKVYHTD